MLKNSKRFWRTFLLIVITFIVLSSGRILWHQVFKQSNSPTAEQGTLDLREWKLDSPILLDGEWEFYPHQFIISEGIANQTSSQYIAVPGNWSERLNVEQPTPYGYGSYRLTLFVDPEQKRSYTIRVGSVRNASKLYVNGILLGQAGVPAHTKENDYPYNIPYNGTFTSTEEGIIEVVIEASNFADARGGGIIRSLKLGTEQAILKAITLSSGLQLLLASIFLVHALYAIMLYIAKLRQPSLLWFALFVISFTVLVMVGSEDKQFAVWFNLNYSMGFRLVLLSVVLMVVALYQLVYPYLLVKHKKYYYVIQALNVLAGISAIFLPLNPLLLVNSWYTTLMLGVVTVCAIVFLLHLNKGYTLNRVYFISLFAVGNHLIWWLIDITLGKKIMYYPFDLIIAITVFSIMYSHHYIQALREKTLLADKLQRNIEQRDEFLANTSHELRNPLHSIINIAQVILDRERLTLSERSVNDLQNVLTVGHRLTLLLNELLDEMSLKGAIRLNQTPLSLHKLVTGVQDLLTYMRRDEDVQIMNKIDRSFPNVWGDENRTIQILYNLMHNALKFTISGSITLHALQQNDVAKISITDTGIGMDEADQKRVFDPYEFGVAGDPLGRGGLGLGLSISKKLVELQGGTIEVNSQPGVGTTFSFTIPLAKADEATKPPRYVDGGVAAVDLQQMLEELPAQSSQDSEKNQTDQSDQDSEKDQAGQTGQTGLVSSIASSLKRAKVLLIDDDSINLDVLYAILENQELDITCSASVEQALKLLEQEEWDLVISDVMMPYMSGYELTRWIRQRHSLTELPVLLLTARSQPQDLQHAFASGANDYIRKPMDAHEVRARVHALTSMKQTFSERLQLEAAWLQAQIQPHFFFNTINSVIALSEIDLDQMKKLLIAFSTYLQDKFRYSSIHDKASIEEELGMVRTYLYIEQARFGDRLKVVWEIGECADLQLPPLTIQPLVENAVRHGLMPSAVGGTVTIRIVSREYDYEISVIDNGVGMTDTTREALLMQSLRRSSNVGLLNTNHRLQWHYRQGLRIESEPRKGTKVSFIVPK